MRLKKNEEDMCAFWSDGESRSVDDGSPRKSLYERYSEQTVKDDFKDDTEYNGVLSVCYACMALRNLLIGTYPRPSTPRLRRAICVVARDGNS